ncbi:hypothetical protein D3C75_922310 [compost metagenome]
MKVGRGLRRQRLEAHPTHTSEKLSHIAHVLRQIGLATMGHRRQVGRIGFHQQPIGRHAPRHLAQRLGIAEGDDAGQGYVVAHAQGRAGHVPVLGETVQDSSLGQVGLGQHRQGIGARLAGMHDHRLAGLPRRLEMQAESGLLQGCRFGLVVVVQAGLADGDHPRVVQFAQQPVEHRLAARLEIQRVHADRAIHVVVGFRQTAHRRGVVGTHADAQEATDAAAACRR